MKAIFTVMCVTAVIHCQSQHNDTVPACGKRWAASFVAPVTLVLGGLAIRGQNEYFKKVFAKPEVAPGEDPNNVAMHIADVSQFLPAATALGLNLAGVHGKHRALRATTLLVETELVMVAMVVPLKHSINETRPDGGTLSFPSGHTAQAFAAATFLHKEFGHRSVWYSIAAYSLASTVGICRMISNRHWMSDVMVGAGIGTLATNVVYLLHRDRKNSLTVTPVAIRGATGLSVTLRL